MTGVPRILSAPDEIYRIDSFAADGRTVRASMPTGPRVTEPDGTVAVGALAVLVDNVLAYASMTAAPGRWSVTTEMTLDAHPALQRTGGVVRAEATVEHADTVGGFAVGTVRSASGELVASCTQRTRFVDGRPLDTVAPDAAKSGPLRTLRPVDILGHTTRLESAGIELCVGHVVQNPLTNLHGGVATYACDRAVARSLAGSRLTTVSLRVAFLRPVPADTLVEFKSTVVHRGRTLAVVDVAAPLADGRTAVVARATAQPSSGQ